MIISFACVVSLPVWGPPGVMGGPFLVDPKHREGPDINAPGQDYRLSAPSPYNSGKPISQVPLWGGPWHGYCHGDHNNQVPPLVNPKPWEPCHDHPGTSAPLFVSLESPVRVLAWCPSDIMGGLSSLSGTAQA